jgi:GNAT superfamily N-acetyltransferase
MRSATATNSLPAAVIATRRVLPNLAEVAFMIAPEFQGAGLGTALQARLQEYAMSRNVRGFVFEILSRNRSMLRLAARARGTVTTSRDADVVHVTALFPDSGNTSRSPLPDSQDPQGRQLAA